MHPFFRKLLEEVNGQCERVNKERQCQVIQEGGKEGKEVPRMIDPFTVIIHGSDYIPRLASSPSESLNLVVVLGTPDTLVHGSYLSQLVCKLHPYKGCRHRASHHSGKNIRLRTGASACDALLLFSLAVRLWGSQLLLLSPSFLIKNGDSTLSHSWCVVRFK